MISSPFCPALTVTDLRFSTGLVLSFKTLQMRAEWSSEKKALCFPKKTVWDLVWQ